MKLLLVRHGIALDREVFARDHFEDDERPLTDEGRAKMAEAASGIARVAPRIVTLASSPLVRSIQTADVLATALTPAERQVTKVLAPGAAYPDFAKWLRTLRPDGAVAVVGHETHLGGLTSWLLDGANEPFIAYKKGGAALLDFSSEPRGGSAVLRWILTPAQLRRLG